MTLRETVRDAVQKTLDMADGARAAARKTVSGTLRTLTPAEAARVVRVPDVSPEEAKARIEQAHAAMDATQTALRNHKNGNGKG